MGGTGASQRGAQRRTPLTRRRIVETALRLIDERGLEALSMRTLGAELGVEAMALYRHVADKGDLLDGVVGLLLEEMGEGVPADGDWRAVVGGFGRGLRSLALAHPNAFPLLGRHPARSWVAAAPGVEGLLAFLGDSGFGATDAAYAVRAVSRYAIGFSLVGASALEGAERPPVGAYPLLDGLLDQLDDPTGRGGTDDLFEYGLGMLLDGLAGRRTGEGSPG
jgi:AcrR family transcriptional regulator